LPASPAGATTAEKFVRRGHLAARESTRRRKTRTQKIVAWNVANETAPANAPKKKSAKSSPPRAARYAESAPYAAQVSRAIVTRLEKSGRLHPGKNPSPPKKTLGHDFTPPANILNHEQKHALAEIWRWLVSEKFTAALLHGVTGKRKNGVYLGAIEAALSAARRPSS